jgi:uncharacterized protein (DUF433 family)
MDWQQWIEHDAQRMGGKPVLKGTRITVEHVVQRLGDGWSESDLLASYPQLSTQHVRAALNYAAQPLASDKLIFLDEAG